MTAGGEKDQALPAFTKGPWRAERTGIGEDIEINSDDLSVLVAIVECATDPESKANARLIAEAPAMYEALQAFCDATTEGARATVMAYQAARAVLSRIEGVKP